MYYGIGAVASIVFLVLAVIIKMSYTTKALAFDGSIQNFAFHLQSSAVIRVFFTNLTNLFGDTGGFITAAVVCLVLFFILKQKIGALWFGILTVASTVVNTVVKSVIGRVRPDIHRLSAFAHERGQSFASGHSVFATVLFGALFLIYFKKMRTSGSKFGFGLLALILPLIIMFSRIFVGVHYPSDTLGGFLEGLAFLMFTYPTFIKFNERNYKLKILQ